MPKKSIDESYLKPGANSELAKMLLGFFEFLYLINVTRKLF